MILKIVSKESKMAAKEEIIDIDFLEKRIKYLESIRDKYVLLEMENSSLKNSLSEVIKQNVRLIVGKTNAA